MGGVVSTLPGKQILYEGNYEKDNLLVSANQSIHEYTLGVIKELNGFNDWFLPSLEELKQLYKAKYAGVISYNGFYTLISSSQQTNSVNYGVDFSNGSTVGMNKNSAGRIWQVRRF